MIYYLYIYIIIVSLLTFIMFGIDKYKARKKIGRLSEKTLLTMVMLGGGPGALLGMEVFRHKTIKGSFLWKFWLIIFFWIILLLIISYYPMIS